ncbi:DinB family protein [Pedobacter cryoconitis]|uniref:Putative damage-inducible protein DinB n=1 Tax=Pedobacter cryoconitis TaxID=188932 RepID=A0A7X0J0L6_9SPHI|nr:DinB family protein [Pedobacter cryoconitis]MBB6498735.1 putative damage-inducible protein DinB [Pedobacter cryoconitis]
MYRSIEDFENDWKNEENSTLQIFRNITDETKSIKIHDNVRSLGRLAWHITQTMPEMGHHAGLMTENLLEGLPIPDSMEEIIRIYQDYNKTLLKRVKSKWTDSTLSDPVEMYGQQWTKGQVLSVFIAHEAHHRAQMTIIMRMVGLPVPGVYGPSREEWVNMGLPAMD